MSDLAVPTEQHPYWEDLFMNRVVSFVVFALVLTAGDDGSFQAPETPWRLVPTRLPGGAGSCLLKSLTGIRVLPKHHRARCCEYGQGLALPVGLQRVRSERGRVVPSSQDATC